MTSCRIVRKAHSVKFMPQSRMPPKSQRMPPKSQRMPPKSQRVKLMTSPDITNIPLILDGGEVGIADEPTETPEGTEGPNLSTNDRIDYAVTQLHVLDAKIENITQGLNAV